MSAHAKVFVEAAQMARANAAEKRRQARLYPRYAESDLRDAHNSYERALGYLQTARQLKVSR